MGRFRSAIDGLRSGSGGGQQPGSAKQRRGAAAGQPERPWYEELAATARAHGAYPYIVEGFIEVVEAVRRGHSVLVRRVPAEVADGVRVFDSPPGGAGAPGTPLGAVAAATGDAVVTILRFDLGTARFELQDLGSGAGAVQLTPKRLQRYLAQPECEVGVALGA